MLFFDNKRRMIGKKVLVLQTIDNISDKGMVVFDGKRWKAKNVSAVEKIIKGEKVKIVNMRNNQMIVKKIKH